MICLVCPAVWKTFITSNSKFVKTEKEILVNQMFNSTINKFEYNRFIRNTLDNFFAKFSDEQFDYNDIIDQIIIYRSDNNLLEESEFDNDLTLIDFFNSENSLSNIFLVDDSNSALNEGIVNYSNIIDNNFSWLLSRLIAQHQGDSLQLSHSDFNSNENIESIIKHMFRVKRIVDKKIYIQNSYQNLGGILNSVKQKKVTYHTTLYNNGNIKTEAEKQIERQNIKGFFTSTSSIKYSRNKTILHPRHVIYGNLVIRTDNDFNEITVSNRNWFINISVCSKRRNEVLNILSEYN